MYLQGDDFGGYPDTTDPDYVKGDKILKAFHLASITYGDYPFLDFEEFKNYYGTKYYFVAENVGMQTKNLGFSDDEAKEILRQMASELEGKLMPTNKYAEYGNALGYKAQNPSMWEALKYTAQKTGEELHDPIMGLKEGVLTTAKYGRYVMPVLIYGGAAFLIYRFVIKGEKAAGSIYKDIKAGTKNLLSGIKRG